MNKQELPVNEAKLENQTVVVYIRRSISEITGLGTEYLVQANKIVARYEGGMLVIPKKTGKLKDIA